MPLPFSRRATQTAPSFSRDFAGLKTLDHGVGPAITFTRASNATYFDASGTLQTASNNTPRFDHSGGSSLGLLIEEARTNLLERSQELDNAYWTKNAGCSVTANADTAPDGTTTADRVTFTSSGQDLLRDVTTAAGTYTASYYVKAGQTGEVGKTIAIGVGDLPYTDKLITLTNTWQRIDASETTAVGTCRIAVHTYAGATARNVLVWGLQLEAGAFPTSYIPTTTAAATRAADSAVVTPISSFYNQSEGTLFAEINRPQVAKQVFFFNAIDAASPSNFISLESGLGAPATQRANMSSSIVSFANGASNTTYKMAAAYAASDFIGAQNGSLTSSSSVTAAQTMSRMNIGMCSDNNSASYGIAQTYIRKVAYYPRRLSNTLLQQLTT